MPMYIRRTQTRSNVTGKRYYTYRLVRPERIRDKFRQVTLLNLATRVAMLFELEIMFSEMAVTWARASENSCGTRRWAAE